MALIRVKDTGRIGLNRDLSNHELPINAWTDCKNIRFLDGYAGQFLGHGEVYETPPVTPYHILPCVIGSARYWIYAGLQKIYAVNLSGGVVTHTNITRQTAGNDVNYTGAANAWTSTLLGGIPVLNAGNTTDPPQSWDLNIANNCAALANWPANTYCKSLRSYKNFLIALNVTKTSTNYPFLVKWSHPAVPGAVPTSWDETDPTKDAGEFDLAEGYDPIVDGLQLRESFIVYKEASFWRMDYAGGVFVFNSIKGLGSVGALNRNCAVEVNGMHFVLTGDDVVLHDGYSGKSALDKMTRRWLFRNIDVDYINTAFVFKNPFFNEAFVCFAQPGSTVPDMALVWNYNDNTVSVRELPDIYHAAVGGTGSELSGTWAQDNDPWDSDETVWNGSDYVPSTAKVLMASNDTKLYLLDGSTTFDGTIPDAYIERRGLSLGAPEKIKLVRGVRPRITGSEGYTVTIKIGSQDDPYEDPTYTSMTHTIGTTVANDCLVSGRYIAIRIEAGTAYEWRLDSFELDVEIIGEW